jgi:N-acetylneuraminic acid mutarotase
MNRSRFEASVVQYQDDLYVFNGFGNRLRAETTIEKFDAGTRQWSVVGTTSVAQGTAVTHNGIVRHGNEVWIIGGRVGNHPGRVTDDVWIYNLDTGKWRSGPDMPKAVAAGGAAIVDNTIHWFGGLDSKARCDVDNHYIYDLDAPGAGWQDISSVASMPMARNHFATVVLDGWIYAVGGQNGHDACPAGVSGRDVTLVHAFNPAKNLWVQKASLPARQSHNEASTIAYAEAIYVVGGEISGDKIYRYDPATNDWDTVLELPSHIVAPIARVIDDQLIMASGGAPSARFPTQTTRSTPISPLLLPGRSLDPQPELLAELDTGLTTPPAAELVVVPNAETIETTGAAEFTHTDQTLIAMEAEQFDLSVATATHAWSVQTMSGASDNLAIITDSNIGTLRANASSSPEVSYFARFDSAGTWYLWLRGLGDTNAVGEGRDDSIHAGLNGSLSNSSDKLHQFPPNWSWSNSTRDGHRASLSIPSPGVHAVNLWMREDGLAVDKLVLTQDPDYRPTGIGPELNDGTTVITSAPLDITEVTEEAVVPMDDIGTDGVSDNSDVVDASPDSESGTSAREQSTGQSVEQPEPEMTVVTPVSGSDLVVVEVENYESATTAGGKQWVSGKQSGASGGKSMVTDPDTGTIRFSNSGSPELQYKVEFSQPGTYTVWARGWGDTVNGEGKSDSVHVGINGTLGSAEAMHEFPSGWHWSSQRRDGGIATIVVPAAGTHTINLWMREDGLILDKLVFSVDQSWIPSGLGPASGDVLDLETEVVVPVVNDSGVVVVDDPAIDELAADGANDLLEDSSESATPIDQSVEVIEPVSPVVGNNGLYIIELEDYLDKSSGSGKSWMPGIKTEVSGTGSMVTGPDTGTIKFGSNESPELRYQIEFSQPGNYTVWARGWGDTVAGEGKSDSVYVGINGAFLSTQALQNFPRRWSWSNERRGGGTISLVVPSAGTHTINLWMREDGLELDQLVLTLDGQWAPDDSLISVAAQNSTSNDSVVVVDGEDFSENNSGLSTASINAANSWSRVFSANGSVVEKRHEAGGVEIDGKLYVLGGRGTRGVSIFDPALDIWKSASVPPVSLHHFQPVVFDERIWIIGAFSGDYPAEDPVASIYTYTPATDRWTAAGVIPVERRRGSAGAVVRDGLIYVLGGNTEGHMPGAVPWFDSYDPVTGEWTVLEDAPNARDHFTIAAGNDRLIAAAGRRSAFPNTWGDMLAATDVYDFSLGTWRNGQTIPTRRAGTMTVNVGDEVIVIGGESLGKAKAHAEVEAYNTKSDQWRTLQHLGQGRHSGAAVVIGDEIHVVSGSEKRGGAPESSVHESLRFNR